MAARRLLVTGLSGLIGGALHKHLGGRYPLRALNRRPIPGVECHQADLGNLDAIQPAFKDIDTVVHLGAASGDNQAPADILRANVIGTDNVFEAAQARRRQARRPCAPADGMSMICLRIGRVREEDRPMAPREFAVWCSQRDIARMIETCIEAPERVRFDVFYVVSNNRWSYRDLERPTERRGRRAGPRHRPRSRGPAPRPPPARARRRQGAGRPARRGLAGPGRPRRSAPPSRGALPSPPAPAAASAASPTSRTSVTSPPAARTRPNSTALTSMPPSGWRCLGGCLGGG